MQEKEEIKNIEIKDKKIEEKASKDHKSEFIRFLKFLAFSCTAGVLQIITSTILMEVFHLTYWPSYLIGLIISVIYNFTINRKFTFKSANNVPIAMTLSLAYYAVFTPLSTLWGDALTQQAHWNEYIVLGITMIINFVTEFLYSRYVIFRKSINTQPTKSDNKSRTIGLIGEENMKKLESANILVIGIGGVGSYVAEALVRAGVEKMTIIDGDKVSPSNINRQLIALESSVGKDKVMVAKRRYLKINRDVKITAIKEFITPENVAYIDFSKFDFVIDAIDYVPGKVAIIEECNKTNTNIISCMGTGNKLHPEKFEITDISKTSVCPLAKTIRKQLAKKGIENIPVLYSKEEPVNSTIQENEKRVPASISTVPSVAGLLIANYVIQKIIESK